MFIDCVLISSMNHHIYKMCDNFISIVKFIFSTYERRDTTFLRMKMGFEMLKMKKKPVICVFSAFRVLNANLRLLPYLWIQSTVHDFTLKTVA